MFYNTTISQFANLKSIIILYKNNLKIVDLKTYMLYKIS